MFDVGTELLNLLAPMLQNVFATALIFFILHLHLLVAWVLGPLRLETDSCVYAEIGICVEMQLTVARDL